MAKIEKKFNKTEYGKKLYKKSITFNILWLIFVFVDIILGFIFEGESYDMINLLVMPIEFIFFMMALYYEGKYKGASEMYNKRMN